MHIINLDHITINYVGRVIFDDLSWAIGDRDRVGLVGPNGAGKSSLLKAIVGEVIPDAGTITRSGPITVGYLPQQITLPRQTRLIDAAMDPPPDLAAVETRLAQYEAQLGDPAVYGDESRLARVLAQQEQALADYDRLDGPRHQSRVREILAHLGFYADDYDLITDTLSGGEKKLVALTKLAAASPSVLLLDEPDNHLDLQAKRRLESFIAHYPGAVVIVSHDRYLLDEVVNKIAELDSGRLSEYVGNYTAYATEREAALLRQQQMYVVQQKRIKQIEEQIKRFDLWAAQTEDVRYARKARHRRKMLQRMEDKGEIIDRVVERRLMDAQFEGWRGSTKALEILGLDAGFDDQLLFLDLSLLIRHGERVGLIGPNGAGKSLLFRMILGQVQPLGGEIKIGPSTQIGYYAQEHQTLQKWLDRTPLDRIRDIRPMPEGEAVAFLLKFHFQYDQLRMPVRTFSGGERSRLQFAVLMHERPNLLLLDEPTNNLDIQTAEVLEGALEDFEGSILTISHDRYFLDRTVDRVLELRDGTLTSFTGGYTDFLEATEQV